MLIAVDHGNYAIKTPHFSFVSGLQEHTVKPPMSDEILEYDGRYWTPSGKRLSYMRDKTQDERYFILTLFAIAKELELAGASSLVESIDLAVGLPPEHYGVLRDKFAQYFKSRGILSIVYNGRKYKIMKKEGKYRFSLQFSADTEEHIRAGELLEKLGNKKSLIVVDALNEYLRNHPELEKQCGSVKLRLTSVYDRDKIEQIVKEIMGNGILTAKETPDTQLTINNGSDMLDDISEMLENISAFG